MSDKVRLIDAEKLGKAIELLCKDERTNMTAITYFALRDLLDTMPTIEAELDKQDSQLSVILQDFGIANAEQLRYILEQYQKLIEEITGGQMSYLTYPAQAVLECANDRYLSVLADLKEDSTVEAELGKGWISVKDRMPEEGVDVLVYLNRKSADVDFVDRESGNFFYYDEGKVTHWRPLPTPPESEDTE